MLFTVSKEAYEKIKEKLKEQGIDYQAIKVAEVSSKSVQIETGSMNKEQLNKMNEVINQVYGAGTVIIDRNGNDISDDLEKQEKEPRVVKHSRHVQDEKWQTPGQAAKEALFGTDVKTVEEYQHDN